MAERHQQRKTIFGNFKTNHNVLYFMTIFGVFKNQSQLFMTLFWEF